VGAVRRRHPLMAPFVAWSRSVDPDFDRDEFRPRVRRYWRLGPHPKERDITLFADKQPALVERVVGKGKAVLFTSPLDRRFLAAGHVEGVEQLRTDSAFGLILVDRVCRYLGGEVTTPELNFVCGQVPIVAPSPPGSRPP